MDTGQARKMAQQFVNPLAKRIKADAKAVARMEEDFKVQFPSDLGLFWHRLPSFPSFKFPADSWRVPRHGCAFGF